MFVCCCLGVSDRAIRRAIEDGAATLEDVARCTGAGTRCGSCRSEVAAMVEAHGCQRRRLPFLSAHDDAAAA
jgi:bacterioferritin-associated ferredoxin